MLSLSSSTRQIVICSVVYVVKGESAGLLLIDLHICTEAIAVSIESRMLFLVVVLMLTI